MIYFDSDWFYDEDTLRILGLDGDAWPGPAGGVFCPAAMSDGYGCTRGSGCSSGWRRSARRGGERRQRHPRGAHAPGSHPGPHPDPIPLLTTASKALTGVRGGK